MEILFLGSLTFYIISLYSSSLIGKLIVYSFDVFEFTTNILKFIQITSYHLMISNVPYSVTIKLYSSSYISFCIY